MTYLLYVSPDGSWSMASVVWAVGQRTPVHSHETWGVAAIYSGVEHELRYLKPVAAVGEEPTVAIHVYGGNIGTIRRRSYDPVTGESRWFVSGWDSPEGASARSS